MQELKQFLKSKGFTNSTIKTYASVLEKVFNKLGRNFTEIGEYRYLIECKYPKPKDAFVQVGAITEAFQVTPTGNSLDSAKSLAYILIFIISFLIFIGLLIIGIALPVSNKRDEMTGYILAVNNLKYLKMFCLGLAYVTLVFMSYFVYNFSYAYLDMTFMTNIFYFIFIGLAYLTLPLFILSSFFTIANLVRDSKVADLLSRGLRTR